MDGTTAGLPVLHYLPEFANIQVHRVSDAIQASHPLPPPLILPSVFPSIRAFPNDPFQLCVARNARISILSGRTPNLLVTRLR